MVKFVEEIVIFSFGYFSLVNSREKVYLLDMLWFDMLVEDRDVGVLINIFYE